MPVISRKSRYWVPLAAGIAGVLALLLTGQIWLARRDTPTELKFLTVTDNIDGSTKAPGPGLSSIPSETPSIYAAVRVTTRRKTTVTAKWYQNEHHLDDVDTELAIDRSSGSWIDFHISTVGPWPAGNYRVELYIGEDLMVQQAFRVG